MRSLIVSALCLFALTAHAGKVTVVDGTNTLAVSSDGGLQSTAQLVNANGNALGVDTATRSLQVMDYAHHEVHAGSHYYVQSYADIAQNHVLQFTFQTPDTNRWTHFSFSIATEAETLW